ncbi:alpha/beta hydrolase [Microbacterium sp. NPDC089189]|uniref:alpha/beta fold hydrolase n=1 Tax=Microbacterium sp. NPDC089189 TaxID=3154972 RepID=UPI0034384471
MTDPQIFEPDGRAIPYAVDGEGPALVLLPALGFNISYLDGLAHSVAQEDFRVVQVGSRRPSDAAVSLDDLAQDVVDVLDHLEVSQAWVGGHAFGGTIARALTAGHPDRVSGVLLLGVEGAASAPDALDWSKIPDSVRDPEVAPLQQAVRDALAGEYPAVASGVPVLVVQGGDDPVAPVANGEALQAAAPASVSVVTVEGARHMFPASHVVPTSWAIEDYLDWD